MILVSTMDFSDMPDIMVLQETILDIALWAKSKMAFISARLKNHSASKRACLGRSSVGQQ